MSTKNQSRAFRAIDLFSGPGGLTTGLKQAGFKVVGAVEFESVACETYAINHPEVNLLAEDIRQIDPVIFMEALNLKSGELELLAGCPPCQGFSTIGTRNRKKDDERNDYVFQMLRFIEAFLPKTIMMENVPGLYKDDRMVSVEKRLRELGYSFEMTVLNTADYGVPQRRRRMIMLCSKLGDLPVDEDTSAISPVTVRDVLAGLPHPDATPDPLHKVMEKRSERVMKMISLIPHDGGSRNSLPPELQLDCHKHTDGFKDVYGRMAWDRPSPTITGGCSSPSKGRFLHPEEDRTITLREAALLQTFPPDYTFSLKGGKSRVAVMIGDALPPVFIRHHASSIAEHLALMA
jgi:DNA (cytosine-5)-methyltransferase 1